MERPSVASSLIRSVGYDFLGSILEIEMGEPSRLYTFYDVPFSVYEELLEAPSKGRYFNDFIRDFYAYEPTDSPPPQMPDDVHEADRPL
jgi:hypothetical protein